MEQQAQKNLEEIAHHYPGVHLVAYDTDKAVYRGDLSFTASYENHGLVDDSFEVELELPLRGFAAVPVAREVGGRIPKSPEFHINDDGTLCLGAPLEVRRKFFEDRSLNGFINLQVVPFLYGYCIKQDKGYWPFGELSHGDKGIVEYYQQVFRVTDILSVIEMLKILIEDNYRGHISCPCGSEKRLRNCHGPQIRAMTAISTREGYFSDFIFCLRHYFSEGGKLPRRLITKRLRKFWTRMGSARDLRMRYFK